MKKTSPLALVLWGVVGAFAGGCLCYVLESLGQALPGPPWPAVAGMVLLAVALFVLGWPIKKWNDGDRTRVIDPLRAARVAMMAKAGALAGAILAGWYVGHVVYVLVLSAIVRLSLAVPYGVAAVAALVLMATGLIVEWFCRLPPDDKGGHSAGDGRRDGKSGRGRTDPDAQPGPA